MDLGKCMDMSLELVSACWADPHLVFGRLDAKNGKLVGGDLQMHHMTAQYYSTNSFQMSSGVAETLVISNTPNGALEHVYTEPGEFPRCHAKDPEIENIAFPIKPEHFSHERTMASHVRLLLDRNALQMEIEDALASKILMPRLQKVLASHYDSEWLLFNHPLLSCCHTAAAQYKGSGDVQRAVKVVDFESLYELQNRKDAYYDKLMRLAARCAGEDDTVSDANPPINTRRATREEEAAARTSAKSAIKKGRRGNPKASESPLPKAPIVGHADKKDKGATRADHIASAVPGMTGLINGLIMLDPCTRLPMETKPPPSTQYVLLPTPTFSTTTSHVPIVSLSLSPT